MRILTATTILESHRILEYYYASKEICPEEIKRLLFAELYARMPYKPDYILKTERDTCFGRQSSLDGFLTSALHVLADMLYVHGHQISVESDRYEEWQETILSVSPLLVLAYKVYNVAKRHHTLDARNLIRTHLARTCLPSVYDPYLKNLCRNPGLIECHMHLNGATEPDIVWQDALSKPSKFYRYLRKSLYNGGVNEQYLQVGNLKPEDLYRLLRIAKSLRDVLIGELVGQNDRQQKPINESLLEEPQNFPFRVHPMENVEPKTLHTPMQYEALFLLRTFEYLHKASAPRCTHCWSYLHYYLLIGSFFQKLLVQQKRQVGFDQFQKITNNELREYTEKDYANRFKQLQGMHGNHIEVLEGRFAAKDSRPKLEKLMLSIKKGYEKKGGQDFELMLVPHFIKTPDKRKPEDIVTFRDLELRLKNQRALAVLLDALHQKTNRNQSFAQKHIVGFDAASNELHASPEVFAPIFRKLAFLGYKNFTYHAGEDFVHLLSGIRAVYETMEFLELRPGNRIGHATALGIEPKLWIKRIGKRLHIKQGDWLDNLIFTYHIASQDAGLSSICRKLEQPILKYFNEVYKTAGYLPVAILIEAWLLRKYDPFLALGWRDPGVFDGFALKEQEEFRKATPKAQELYRKYHTGDSIQESNKLILIDTDELISPKELRLLQSWMLTFLEKKDLAIEMLPSSNVRISHYKSYKEHHVRRWLGLTHPSDPQPMVVVGSDDTGIFMTNLQNEYAHIQRIVQLKEGKSKANEIIAALASNSRVYSFK